MRPDLKTMLDDVRARDAALMNLMLFVDRQAMALFRVYVTVGVASAAASAAGQFNRDVLFHEARWATLAAALVLAFGCFACLKAMVPSKVGLPGRGAEFWVWARDELVTEDQMIAQYLGHAEASQAINRITNGQTAAWLSRAKRAGIAAPLAGLLVGAVGLFF